MGAVLADWAVLCRTQHSPRHVESAQSEVAAFWCRRMLELLFLFCQKSANMCPGQPCPLLLCIWSRAASESWWCRYLRTPSRVDATTRPPKDPPQPGSRGHALNHCSLRTSSEMPVTWPIPGELWPVVTRCETGKGQGRTCLDVPVPLCSLRKGTINKGYDINVMPSAERLPRLGCPWQETPPTHQFAFN